MRLGMVRTAAGELSVAVQRESDGWVPLLTVPGADQLGPARTDLLAWEMKLNIDCKTCRSVRRRSVIARCGRNT